MYRLQWLDCRAGVQAGWEFSEVRTLLAGTVGGVARTTAGCSGTLLGLPNVSASKSYLHRAERGPQGSPYDTGSDCAFSLRLCAACTLLRCPLLAELS